MCFRDVAFLLLSRDICRVRSVSQIKMEKWLAFGLKGRNGPEPVQERIRIKSGWRRRAEALVEKDYDGRDCSWKTPHPLF